MTETVTDAEETAICGVLLWTMKNASATLAGETENVIPVVAVEKDSEKYIFQ